MRNYLLFCYHHFTEEEAQRGHVSCPGSCSPSGLCPELSGLTFDGILAPSPRGGWLMGERGGGSRRRWGQDGGAGPGEEVSSAEGEAFPCREDPGGLGVEVRGVGEAWASGKWQPAGLEQDTCGPGWPSLRRALREAGSGGRNRAGSFLGSATRQAEPEMLPEEPQQEGR